MLNIWLKAFRAVVLPLALVQVGLAAWSSPLRADGAVEWTPKELADWTKCLGGAPKPEDIIILDAESLPGPEGRLRIRLDAPGVDFEQAKAHLKACIKTSAGYQRVVVRDVKNGSGDGESAGADAAVIVPGWARPTVYDDGELVVLHEAYIARADFRLIGPVPAALFAVLLVVVGHVLIRQLILTRKGAWLDWFTGVGQRPSLSLFQIYLWTWVVIAGAAYVVLVTGDLLAVTPEVLALLGIAGVGSVAARMVAVQQDRPIQTTESPTFTDIFKTDGKFDLYKLQMFLFTVGTAAYVIARIFYAQAFPQLEANLLLLLGISNGIYVGSKVAAGESPFQLAEQLDVQVKLLEEAKLNAEGRKKLLEASIGATNTSIAAATAAGAPANPQFQTDLKLFEAQLKEATAKLAELEKSIDEKTNERTAAVEKLK